MKGQFVCWLLLAMLAFQLQATTPDSVKVVADSVYTFTMNGKATKYVMLPTFNVIGANVELMNAQERRANWRLIRDVKITLPYAKLFATTLIETYEYIETLPTEKAKREHLDRVYHDLKKTFFPKMMNLTKRQGVLLIKLVSREAGDNSYDIVKSFYGGFVASIWNTFAKLYGTTLKQDYDPVHNPEDAKIEQVVRLVEAGYL